MPRSRDGSKGHTPAEGDRDPRAFEAYEESWYALLARQASGEGEAQVQPPPAAGGSPEPEPEDPPLASVTPLVVPRQAPPAPPPEPARFEPPAPTPKPPEPARRVEPSSIRLGVRRLDEPGSVYLAYLTSSPHHRYFRSEWWPSSPTISPTHLWRANHLGADWDIADVERFMSTAAGLADELVAAAPRSAPAGSRERRDWLARFVSARWVHEFGIGRVSKTLHAVLPEFVADLDPEMVVWARGAWLGVRGRADARDPEMWLETCDLLEDVLVLRGQQLGQIVQRLRALAPGLAPNGRLGPVMAAFWESYWREAAATPTWSSARRTYGRSKTGSRRARSRASDREDEAGEPSVQPARRPRASGTAPARRATTPRRSSSDG